MTRFRPILLTSLTTFIGLLPLLFELLLALPGLVRGLAQFNQGRLPFLE